MKIYYQKLSYDILFIFFINFLFFNFYENIKFFVISIFIDTAFVLIYFYLKLYKNTPNIRFKIIFIILFFIFSGFLKILTIENYIQNNLYIINVILSLFLVLPRYFLNLEIINSSFSNQYLSSKKNILVIGGLGYIGSHLVKSLLEEDKSVTVLDCKMYGDEVLNKFNKFKNFKFIKAYASDVIALSKAIKDSEIVIHLAGLVGDPACALDESETKYLNIKTTSIIKNLCYEYNVKRLIFASSCSVYGKSDDKISDEDSKLNPVSLYAHTKKDSENELLNGRFSNVTIVRFATVFGHSLRERYDLVCNLFCAQAFFYKKITLDGGKQRRPFIHVKDAARSIKILIETKEKIAKQIYNIGFDDQNYSIEEIGKIVRSKLPETRIEYSENKNDERDYYVNFNKFNRLFKFSKSFSLENGISEMIKNLNLKEKNWNHTNIKYNNTKTTEYFLEDFRLKKETINNF